MTEIDGFRHVALLQINGNDYQLDPIPLRTVRPFVMDEVYLQDAAEEEGLDVNDQIEVSKYLKNRVLSISHTCMLNIDSCSWSIALWGLG